LPNIEVRWRVDAARVKPRSAEPTSLGTLKEASSVLNLAELDVTFVVAGRALARASWVRRERWTEGAGRRRMDISGFVARVGMEGKIR